MACSVNGGSALAAGSVAVSAVVATHIAACCSGAVWIVLAWLYHKPSAVAVMNGAVAGLAGITPASGYIGIPVRTTRAIWLCRGLVSGADLRSRCHIAKR